MTEPLTPEEEATFRDLVANPAGDGKTGLHQVRRLLATLDAARAQGRAEALDVETLRQALKSWGGPLIPDDGTRTARTIARRYAAVKENQPWLLRNQP